MRFRTLTAVFVVVMLMLGLVLTQPIVAEKTDTDTNAHELTADFRIVGEAFDGNQSLELYDGRVVVYIEYGLFQTVESFAVVFNEPVAINGANGLTWEGIYYIFPDNVGEEPLILFLHNNPGNGHNAKIDLPIGIGNRQNDLPEPSPNAPLRGFGTIGGGYTLPVDGGDTFNLLPELPGNISLESFVLELDEPAPNFGSRFEGGFGQGGGSIINP